MKTFWSVAGTISFLMIPAKPMEPMKMTRAPKTTPHRRS